MKILVLDGELGAVTSVVQSLGRRRHRCWIGASTRRASAFRSRYASKTIIYPHPFRSLQRFQSWLVDLQDREHFDVVLPCSEVTLLPVAQLRREAGLFVLPPRPALEKALDKEESRKLAVAHGLQAPRTVILRAGESPDVALAAAAVPLVIKPLRSKIWMGDSGTSLHARVVRSEQDLVEAVRSYGGICDLQIQEWVPGKGVEIEVLVDRGHTLWTFAHERIHEYPLQGGASTYRKSIPVPAAPAERVVEMMQALAWHGVAMVELRYDEARETYWFMEINPRFWGSLPLAIASGFDFPAGLVSLAENAAVHPVASRPRTRFARSLSGDVRWLRARLMQTSSPGTPLPGLAKSACEWLRVLGGREVWDGASWRDPGPITAEAVETLKRETRALAARVRDRVLLRSRRAHNRRVLSRVSQSSRVVFVCWGNICRSPYAARRIRTLLAPEQEIVSAGVGADRGRVSPDLFVSAAAARGIDMTGHRATPIEGVDEDDLVVVFDSTSGHRFLREWPAARARTLWLGPVDPLQPVPGIADPYGCDMQDMAFILARIDRCCRELATHLGGASAARGGVARPGDEVPRQAFPAAVEDRDEVVDGGR